MSEQQFFERVDIHNPNLVVMSLLWQLAFYNFFLGWIRDGDTVIDVACGSGHCLKSMAQQRPHSMFYGVDISPEVIEYNKANFYARNIEYVEGNMVDFGIPNMIDVIVSTDSIEHITKEEGWKFVKNCSKHLEDNGIFICCTPRFFEGRSENRKKYHVYEYTVDKFKEILEDNFGRVVYFGRNEQNIFFMDDLELARSLIGVCMFPKRI